MNYLKPVEAQEALRGGYILQNIHGYTVYLKKNKQIKSNPKRFKRDYQFDRRCTWSIYGELSIFRKLQNFLYMLLDDF